MHTLPRALVRKVRDVDGFLRDATRTDTSWAALYDANFAGRLPGSRVLEIGAGDGLNALVMAALGAQVTCAGMTRPNHSSGRRPPMSFSRKFDGVKNRMGHHTKTVCR